MSTLSKEQFKYKIISQFNTEESAIWQIMAFPGGQNRYVVNKMFTCSEFMLNIFVKRLEETNKFQVRFEEYDDSDKINRKNKDYDLTGDLKWMKRLVYEKINITSTGIEFIVEEKILYHEDYDFRLKNCISNEEAISYNFTTNTWDGHGSYGSKTFIERCSDSSQYASIVYHKMSAPKGILKAVKSASWIDNLQEHQKRRFLRLICRKNESQDAWYMRDVIYEMQTIFLNIKKG